MITSKYYLDFEAFLRHYKIYLIASTAKWGCMINMNFWEIKSLLIHQGAPGSIGLPGQPGVPGEDGAAGKKVTTFPYSPG